MVTFVRNWKTTSANRVCVKLSTLSLIFSLLYKWSKKRQCALPVINNPQMDKYIYIYIYIFPKSFLDSFQSHIFAHSPTQPNNILYSIRNAIFQTKIFFPTVWKCQSRDTLKKIVQFLFVIFIFLTLNRYI